MTIPLMIEAGLRSGLLCTALWLATKAFKLRNPHIEKKACTFALAASLIMPILMRGMCIVIPTGGLLTAPAAIPSISPVPFAPFASTPLAGGPSTWEPLASGFTWRADLAAFYLIVAGFLLFRLTVGLALACRLWLAARPVPGLGLRVRVSPALHAPVTFGRTVLLPAESTNWPDLKLRAVLMHEGAHVRNLDFHVQFLASVNCALFWFNPAAWWLKSRLADLAEMTSDIATIEGLDGDRASYAEILLEVASCPSRIVGVAMARSAKVAWRIEWILNATTLPRRLGRRAGLALVMGLLPLILLTAVGTPPSARAGVPTSVEGGAGMQARQVAPFDKIEISGPWAVDLTVGQTQSVEVTANPEALAHIVTEVQDGTLRVSLDRSWDTSFNPRLAMRISMPRLDGLHVNGNGTANLAGFSGGESTFDIKGSWKIKASGRLNTYKLLINGSGEASFDALAATDVSLVMHGRGQAQVKAERTLNVVINGRGTVRYAGSPSIRQTIHGSGSVAAM